MPMKGLIPLVEIGFPILLSTYFPLTFHLLSTVKSIFLSF
jgi:hypothetical protein